MNKKNILIFALACLLAACDSGDIYPDTKSKESYDITVHATFGWADRNAFPENYAVVFGAYIGNSPYPLAFEAIEKPAENGDINVSLSNLPKGTTALKLCLADKVEHKTIYTFYAYSLADAPKTDIHLPKTGVDAATFGRVQVQVFSQCLQCHGGGSSVSAGLNLTEAVSHAQLVGVASSVKPEQMRVVAGNPTSSFLMDILTNENAVRYNHTKITTLKTPDDADLVREWIRNGAENN